MSGRWRISLAVVLLALASSGCVPGVAWFPDGKRFAFTDFRDPKANGAALLTYDVERKTLTTLVKDTGTRTLWPAVSPDGKRLAVARHQHVGEGKPSQLQVILYRADGKVDKRSKAFAWQPSPSGRAAALDETFLHWSSPDHIVVLAGKTAIYDVAGDRLVPVPGCTPWLWGASPVRPDGKGFLATRERKTGSELVFVNWKGEVTPLGGKIPAEQEMGSVPFLVWEGNTAHLRARGLTVRADTEKKTVVRDRTAGKLPLPAHGELVSWHLFPDTGLSLCGYSQSDPNSANGQQIQRIEVQDPVAKTRRVLASPLDGAFFVPSPDRTRVAVRCVTTGANGVIFVYDSKGTVLAELPVVNR